MFGADQADVDRIRAVVEPGADAPFVAKFVVARGGPEDEPRLVQLQGLAGFVAVATGVFGPGEADVDRGRTVVEPHAAAQIVVATVIATGYSEDLPCCVQMNGLTELGAVAGGVLAAREADVDRGRAVVEPGAVRRDRSRRNSDRSCR